jgi:hypothetical protein
MSKARKWSPEETPRATPRSSEVREITPRESLLEDVTRDGVTQAYGSDAVGSRIDEVRRLYASGEIEAARELAATVRPQHVGFSLASIPEVTLTSAQLRALPLDHRAGFVLDSIDGQLDLETVLEISAMPLDEALGVFEHLMALGAITLSPPRRL